MHGEKFSARPPLEMAALSVELLAELLARTNGGRSDRQDWRHYSRRFSRWHWRSGGDEWAALRQLAGSRPRRRRRRPGGWVYVVVAATVLRNRRELEWAGARIVNTRRVMCCQSGVSKVAPRSVWVSLGDTLHT
eukprot:6203299-Pleurochrysis_carterae.AAC.2